VLVVLTLALLDILKAYLVCLFKDETPKCRQLLHLARDTLYYFLDNARDEEEECDAQFSDVVQQL